MSLRKALLNLLFPPKCPFCGKVAEQVGVCPRCEAALPWTCGDETTRQGPGGLCCAAPLWYEDLTRDGILRLKFGNSAGAAEPMGELLARCAAAEFGGEFDTVTWVPVSGKRLRERGYDQAELLARAACRLWDTQPVRLLHKTVHTPAQSGIQDAAKRRANVLGTYALAPGAEIAGRKILLIDDVCTTGATLTECVRMLRDAGAAGVVCATVGFSREKKAKSASRSDFPGKRE